MLALRDSSLPRKSPQDRVLLLYCKMQSARDREAAPTSSRGGLFLAQGLTLGTPRTGLPPIQQKNFPRPPSTNLPGRWLQRLPIPHSLLGVASLLVVAPFVHVQAGRGGPLYFLAAHLSKGGSGFRVWGLGWRVLGWRVEGTWFGVYGLWFEVQGLGVGLRV